MIDYYKELSKYIDRNMTLEMIQRALSKRINLLSNRMDPKSQEHLGMMEDALSTFATEESRRTYEKALEESLRTAPPEDPLEKKRQELEKWKTQAKDYVEKKTFDLAQVAVGKALALAEEIRSSDGGLYELASVIYRENKRYKEAFGFINEAIVLEPDNTDFLIAKANIYFRRAETLDGESRFLSQEEQRKTARQDWNECLKLLREAVSTAEKNGDAQNQANALGCLAQVTYFPFCSQGGMKLYDGNREQGLRYAAESRRFGSCEEALDVFDTEFKKWKPKELAERALEYLESGDLELAVRIAAITDTMGFAGGEEDALIHVNQAAARVYLAAREYEKVLANTDEVLTLEWFEGPRCLDIRLMKAQAHGGWAKALAEEGDFQKYREQRAQELSAYRIAADMTADGELAKEKACVYGLWAEALYFGCDRVDAKKAEEERAQGVASACQAQRRGGDRRAEAVLQKEFESLPLKELKERAKSLLDSKDLDPARRAIEQVLAREGDRATGYTCWLAARIYTESMDYETALGYADRRIALEPENPASFAAKAAIYGKRYGILVKADDFSSSPKAQEAYRRDRAEALVNFRKAASLAQESGDAKRQAFYLGHLARALYIQCDRIDGKKAAEERAEGLALAGRALSMGESESAQLVLDREEKRKQEEERKRQEEQAREWERKADKVWKLYQDAITYAENGKRPEAKCAMDQAMVLAKELNIPNGEFYQASAGFYLAISELEAAMDCIDEALRLEPDSAENIGTKAWICAYQLREFTPSGPEQVMAYNLKKAEAVAMASRAAAMAENGASRETQGYTLGILAEIIYHCADRTDPQKAATERAVGVKFAVQALELDKSGPLAGFAESILEDYKSRQAKQQEPPKKQKGFWGRLFG